MIFKWIKTISFIIFIGIAFLIATFPYERLAPQIKKITEKVLSDLSRQEVSCVLEGFDLKFLGFGFQVFRCTDSRGSEIIDLEEGFVQSFIFKEKIEAKVGRGTFKLVLGGGSLLGLKKVSAEFDQVPLQKWAPLLMLAVNRLQPMAPTDLIITGDLTGKIDFPLKNIHTGNGEFRIKISNLTIPRQPRLDMTGLPELKFSKSTIQTRLEKGKLIFEDIAFLSNHLSGKVEGSYTFDADLAASAGDMTMKWKIQTSDALLSSPIGAILANAPCPSPDSEGFCSRRMTRF